MKKVIIICIASFVFVSLSSQSTFSKSIDLDNGDESGMAIRVVEDGYLLLSGDGCFQFGYSFLKTDFDGNILWKKQLPAYPLYSTPDCYGNHGIAFKKGNNAIYYSGNLEPQGSTSDVFLMKTDENGDSIWLRTYVNPHTDKNATVLYRTDSTLLLFGDHALGSTNDDVIRLIETDLEGNVIWGGQYGNEFRMVGRQDIAQLDNGDIVFTYLASEKGNFDTIFLKITRINNQGLEVWTKDVNNLEYLWN